MLKEKIKMENKEQNLEEFGELMQEVAELPVEKIEKVCIFIQGFIAARERRTRK